MSHHGLSIAVFISLALGGVGIYLMLPRGTGSDSRFNRWFGGALATLSLILIAFPVTKSVSGSEISLPLFTLRFESFSESVSFTILAAISIGSAAMTITSRNPIYSALWFALVLLANSGLYLLQGAEFLAASTVIVYAGAIIVTFLFVIMLAQPRGTAAYDRYSREPMMACLAGVILSGTLLGTLHYSMFHERGAGPASAAGQGPPPALPSKVLVQSTLAQLPNWETSRIPPDEPDPNEPDLKSAQGHVASLGRALFLDHYVSIQIIGVLLLVAVVGAVLIASHPVGPGPQDASAKHSAR